MCSRFRTSKDRTFSDNHLMKNRKAKCLTLFSSPFYFFLFFVIFTGLFLFSDTCVDPAYQSSHSEIRTEIDVGRSCNRGIYWTSNVLNVLKRGVPYYLKR